MVLEELENGRHENTGERSGAKGWEKRGWRALAAEKKLLLRVTLTLSHPVKHSPLLPIHKPQYTLFFPFFFFGLLFLVVFVVWVFGLLQDSGLGETTVPEAQKRVEGALRFAPKEILSGSGWFKAKAARIYTEREREKKRYSLFHAIFSLWRQLISLLLSLYQRFIFCLSDAFSFLCVFCKPFLRRVFRARSFRFLSVQASSTSS